MHIFAKRHSAFLSRNLDGLPKENLIRQRDAVKLTGKQKPVLDVSRFGQKS